MDVGRPPLRLLFDKSSKSRDTNFPTCGGMLPEMLFEDKSSLIRLPIREGMDP
jgi:hypothetical protein